MKTTRLMLAATMALALFLEVASCKQGTGAITGSTSPGGAQASWSGGGSNISDLATYSQLIAIGVIGRVVETIQQSEHMYVTAFGFRVETTLKGKPDGEIIIHQLGTADKPWTAVMDDPLFQTGERYLLFLRRGINTPGIYAYPGPRARYKIVSGKVYSMNYVLQNNQYTAPEALDFNGVELTALTATITETLDTVRFLSFRTTTLLSGEAVKKEVTLATGKHGEGKVTYTISRVDGKDGGNPVPLPAGMEISIEPAEFMASPYTDYKSVIEIRTDEETITPGEYWISVAYDIGGFISRQHQITVYIHTQKLSEIETRPQQE